MYFSNINEIPRFITGFGAVLISCFFLVAEGSEAKIIIASIYFIIACTVDTLLAKIPNSLNASLTMLGLALFFYTDGWSGLLASLTGLALGLSLLILPWLMGGMGAGDVKALGALGALVGPRPLLHVFIYMGLIGGIMAVLHYLFARNLKEKAVEWLGAFKATVLTNDPGMMIPTKTEPLRFPYAAAIAFGYYTYLTFGEVF